MDQRVVQEYTKRKYSLDDILKRYGLDPKVLNHEHEDHKINRYRTFYRDLTADKKYFFPGLHGWTRLESSMPETGKWVADSEDYGDEADDTHMHEGTEGHLGYGTGDEEFVRANTKYARATGKKPDAYMNSV